MPPTWSDGPLGTIAALTAFAVLCVVLEVIERTFAPPETEDPRLGVVAFWLSVGAMAITMDLAWPLIKHRDNWLERGLAVAFWGAWAAWKAGLLGERDSGQREREQRWAATVGATIGAIMHEWGPRLGL